MRDTGGPPMGEINPYAAPEAPVEEVQAPSVPTGVFRSTTSLAKALTVTLTLLALFHVLQIFQDLSAIKVMQRVVDHAAYERSELTAIDQRAYLAGVANSLLYLVVTVQFCMFMVRSNRNARAFGLVTPEFTPGWAAGVFFVPIWSLYKPYRAVREIWNGSDPDPHAAISFVPRPAPALIKWWWALFLIMNFSAQQGVFFREKTPEDFIGRAEGGIVHAGLTAVAAVLGVAVIRAVAARQEERQRNCPAGTPLPTP